MRGFSKCVRKVGVGLADILFPPTCVCCGVCLTPLVRKREVLCKSCFSAWEKAWLPVADEPVRDMPADGMTPPISLVAYRSHHTEGIPERVIYHIKHKDDRRVFSYMGEQLAPMVEEVLCGMGVPCRELLVTYPPRRSKSKRADGFDQAQRLAQSLAKTLEGQAMALLSRTDGGNAEQKKLNAHEREVNALAAYRLKEKNADLVAGRVIVLVDDLYTTGATLRSCAKLLLEADALLVVQVSVGRTVSLS